MNGRFRESSAVRRRLKCHVAWNVSALRSSPPRRTAGVLVAPNPMTGRQLLAFATIALLTSARPALAIQPLEVFLTGAQKANVDALEAQAVLAQTQAQHDVSLGRVLPGVSAKGTYTRNQYDVTFPLGETDPVTGAPVVDP